MLVAAFAGRERVWTAYDAAIAGLSLLQLRRRHADTLKLASWRIDDLVNCNSPALLFSNSPTVMPFSYEEFDLSGVRRIR